MHKSIKLVAFCVAASHTVASLPPCSGYPSTLSISSNFTAACVRTDDGSVASVIDLASGRAYESFTSIFELSLSEGTTPSAPQRRLISGNFSTITVKPDPTTNCVHAQYSNSSGDVASVIVSWTACPDPANGIELILWSANVSGLDSTDFAITGFTFPNIAMPISLPGSSHSSSASAGLSDPSGDFFLLGQSDSVLLPVSHSSPYSLQSTYPGDASIQLMARYDNVSGFLFYTADAAGSNVKRMSLDSNPAGGYCILSITHVPPQVPAMNLFLTYNIALTTFTGDWHDAADIYKAWATQQWWASTPLANRTDIPPVLLSGAAGWTPGIQVW